MKYDKQWIAHQDSFNDLLASLNTTEGKLHLEKSVFILHDLFNF